jgi:hypothetical protein
MNCSVDRIMTTHVGSLPRPSDLVELYRDDAPDNRLLPPIEVPCIDRGHVKSLEHLDLISMTFGRLTATGRPIYSSDTMDETVRV